MRARPGSLGQDTPGAKQREAQEEEREDAAQGRDHRPAVDQSGEEGAYEDPPEGVGDAVEAEEIAVEEEGARGPAEDEEEEDPWAGSGSEPDPWGRGEGGAPMLSEMGVYVRERGLRPSPPGVSEKDSEAIVDGGLLEREMELPFKGQIRRDP